ncbi:MAG: hypothetical protein ACXAB4_11570, partial [Candidatus Hodarchaeales archaeon]
MDLFSKKALGIVLVVALFFPNIFIVRFATSECYYAKTKGTVEPMAAITNPNTVWELSTLSLGIFGYDEISHQLLALGGDRDNFFFFRQPSEMPEWWHLRKFERFVWEEAIDIVPYGDHDLAILTGWIDYYRLLNISSGEP